MKKGKIKTDENNEAKLEKQRLAAAATAKKKKDLLHKYLKVYCLFEITCIFIE